MASVCVAAVPKPSASAARTGCSTLKPLPKRTGRFIDKLAAPGRTKSICGHSRNLSEGEPMRTWSKPAVVVTLSAAAILMVTMGARQSLGLFVSPLNTSTGLGITTISFALAVGQFMWGAIQPVAGAVADRYGPAHHHTAGASAPWEAVRHAMGDRSYLLLHAGFFTCGFHIAFLVTHLPGEVNLCGLPPSVASWSLALIGLANIVGSLIAGSSTSRFRSKYILAVMYGSRALLIGWYLMAPKTEWTFYIFAVGLGLTWLATVPPTAAIVGKLFGIRYLATLFRLTLLSHQIGGGFLGGFVRGARRPP